MRNLLILLTLLNSACSSFPNSTNELWKRSGYLDESKPQKASLLQRKIEKKEKIYVGKRILPNGEIFEEGTVTILMDKID